MLNQPLEEKRKGELVATDEVGLTLARTSNFNRNIPADSRALHPATGWPTGAWPPWGLTQPRQAVLVRNNPLAGGGVDTIVANMVGRGIRPLWNIDDKDILNRVQDAWFDSVDETDAGGGRPIIFAKITRASRTF